jgi:hypothetical protein
MFSKMTHSYALFLAPKMLILISIMPDDIIRVRVYEKPHFGLHITCEENPQLGPEIPECNVIGLFIHLLKTKN